MELLVRDLPFEIPKYSLTGDILSFLRCGRQYRYYSGSSLPPSRPVQLWTGEFVHGVLEEAYLYWNNHHPNFPWPCTPTPYRGQTPEGRLPYDIGQLGQQVESRLAASGKTARNTEARQAAYNRVEAAINKLGPHLFPLITTTEEKIKGTQDMPVGIVGIGGQHPRGDRYELTGIVDVISHISIANNQNNPLVHMILDEIPNSDGDFDIIVDYKAARRPLPAVPTNEKNYWEHQKWQVQTYAWLRQQQLNTNPVRAGVIIYINELSPSNSDMAELQREIRNNQTDVIPENGSQDYYEIHRWGQGSNPNFSTEFLFKRAIRIIPVNDQEIEAALTQINDVIAQIELCALNENATGNIHEHWNGDGGGQDCDACDFRRFCVREGADLTPPGAPG